MKHERHFMENSINALQIPGFTTMKFINQVVLFLTPLIVLPISGQIEEVRNITSSLINQKEFAEKIDETYSDFNKTWISFKDDTIEDVDDTIDYMNQWFKDK